MALTVRTFSSVAELRKLADPWDELWQNSDVTDPTARAELLAIWLEHFAAKRPIRAIVVEENGRFMAALLLVEQRVRRLLKTGHIPSNGWALGGGFLVRQDVNASAAVDLLVRQMQQLRWPLLWFECVRLDSPGYRLLCDAVARAGIPFSSKTQYEVGMIETTGNWSDYCAALSANTRKNLKRWQRKVEGEPGVRIVHWPQGTPLDLPEVIKQCFALEHATWKGANGSSVIGRGVLPYFLRQAEALQALGHFSIYLMYVGEKLIAFQYKAVAKGVCHDCKTSFDEEFKHLAPGQFLYQHITRLCFDDPAILRRDNLGAVSEASRIWLTHSYRIGQLLIAPRGLLGRFLLNARKRWRGGRSSDNGRVTSDSEQIALNKQ